MKYVKGTDVGLSGKKQIQIALIAIHNKGGKAEMKDIYDEVENHIYPNKLSEQGKASLRFFVNKIAVNNGLIYKHDPSNKGWVATKKGLQSVSSNSLERKPNMNNKNNKQIPAMPQFSGVRHEKVDPDIQSWKNRPIDHKRIEKYQNDYGMWNDALGDEIKIAELPDGTQYKFDGSHRCVMWKAAFPGQKIDAKIIQAPDEATISAWYEACNKEARKEPKPDELFMHQYQKEKPLVDLLYKSGLKVVNGKEAMEKPVCTGPNQNTVGAIKSVPVTVSGLRKIRRREDTKDENISGASKLLQRAMPNMDKMPIDLLGGMTIVFEKLELDKSKCSTRRLRVEKYINNLYENLYSRSSTKVSTFLKQKGGKVGNKDIESVALGILEGLKDSKAITTTGFFNPFIRDIKSKLKTKVK